MWYKLFDTTISIYEFIDSKLDEEQLITEIEKIYKKFHPSFNKSDVDWDNLEYLLGLILGCTYWDKSVEKYSDRCIEYLVELLRLKINKSYKIIDEETLCLE